MHPRSGPIKYARRSVPRDFGKDAVTRLNVFLCSGQEESPVIIGRQCLVCLDKRPREMLVGRKRLFRSVMSSQLTCQHLGANQRQTGPLT